jgi:hypothetical protein
VERGRVSAGVDLRDFVADVLHRCLEANVLDKLPAGCEAGYLLADALTAAGVRFAVSGRSEWWDTAGGSVMAGDAVKCAEGG